MFSIENITFHMLAKVLYICFYKNRIMEFEIFADETHIKDNDGNEFLGIGCLFVQVENKYRLVKKLSNLRCLNDKSKIWSWESSDCRYNCKYHRINDFEIHFKEIENSTSKTKIKICRNWVNFIINHNRHIRDKDKLLYFNILYLDLEKLDFDIFGVEKDTTNIYNRFFRSVILSARSFYFKNQDFTIKEIFHDIADEKESHDYFYRQPIDFLNVDERIKVRTNRIKFIDSDHKNHCDEENKRNAHLIQLIDLILGCCNQILFRTSGCENKNKVAGDFYPLFKEMWTEPYDYKNHFNYFQSQQVQIFPKTSIKSQYDLDGELGWNSNQFHRDIKISDPRNLVKRTTLDEWF